MRDYLYKWIQENYEVLAQSEWYEENFDGEEMEDIEVDFFINTYLIPLIESNISYDFGVEFEGRTLFER